MMSKPRVPTHHVLKKVRGNASWDAFCSLPGAVIGPEVLTPFRIGRAYDKAKEYMPQYEFLTTIFVYDDADTNGRDKYPWDGVVKPRTIIITPRKAVSHPKILGK